MAGLSRKLQSAQQSFIVDGCPKQHRTRLSIPQELLRRPAGIVFTGCINPKDRIQRQSCALQGRCIGNMRRCYEGGPAAVPAQRCQQREAQAELPQALAGRDDFDQVADRPTTARKALIERRKSGRSRLRVSGFRTPPDEGGIAQDFRQRSGN